MINLRALGGEKETNSQTSQQGNNVLKQQQCNDLGQSLVTWSFEEKNGAFLRLLPPSPNFISRASPCCLSGRSNRYIYSAKRRGLKR